MRDRHLTRRDFVRLQLHASTWLALGGTLGLSCNRRAGRDTAALAREFVGAGFEAILVAVDPAQLDASFVGRSFDHELLDDLPDDVDPCGENGEFHTFVHAGPVFSGPIEVERGEVVTRTGFAFQDLVPR